MVVIVANFLTSTSFYDFAPFQPREKENISIIFTPHADETKFTIRFLEQTLLYCNAFTVGIEEVRIQ